MKVAVVGTFDTKQAEYALLIASLRDRGAEPVLIDVGVFDSELGRTSEVSTADVARAAGADLEDLRRGGDRGAAVAALARGLGQVLAGLRDGIDAAVAIAGGGGSFIIGEGMRSLPLGFPKILVSTVDGESLGAIAAGQDITLISAPVDIAGSNPILRRLIDNAAAAAVAMASVAPAASERPLVGVTMMGITDHGVSAARRAIENAGCDTVTVTSNGSGRLLEQLLREERVSGVLDLTTTEIAAELLDGPFTAGPDRLTAAVERGVPLVVAPGGIDIVGFRERSTVPARLDDRHIVEHNPRVTLVRTSVEDGAEVGRRTAELVNAHPGSPRIVVPVRGFSSLSVEGAPFWDPDAVEAYVSAVRETLIDPDRLVLIEASVLDPEFAEAAASALLAQY